MKVEFLKSFSKDLDSVRVKSIRQSLIRLIQFVSSPEIRPFEFREIL